MIAELPTLPELDFVAVFEEQRRRYRAAPYPSLEARLANLTKLERAIKAKRQAIRDALYADFRKSFDETEFTE